MTWFGLKTASPRAGTEMDAVRRTAVEAIRNLAAQEASARDYLRATSSSQPGPDLKLDAVEILRPAAAWVAKSIADPEAAAAVSTGAPVVSLQFTIAGDRNVVDVVLLNGAPIATDYH